MPLFISTWNTLVSMPRPLPNTGAGEVTLHDGEVREIAIAIQIASKGARNQREKRVLPHLW